MYVYMYYKAYVIQDVIFLSVQCFYVVHFIHLRICTVCT